MPMNLCIDTDIEITRYMLHKTIVYMCGFSFLADALLQGSTVYATDAELAVLRDEDA